MIPFQEVPMKKVLVVLAVLGLFTVGLVPCSHAKDSPEEAKAMVESAIAYYKSAGKEKALAEINNPNGRFKKGDLYVFVYDMKGVAVARPVGKGLVGLNIMNLRDPDGKAFVKERIDLVKAKGKGWQDYKFENPSTKKIEAKTAYIEGYDDYIFGCGAYK
jgi:cytochrome c